MRTQLLLPVALFLWHAIALADGGMVQFRKVAGTLVITVFAAPSPLSTGPADFSVLVQNRDNLEPVLDASVSLLLSPHDSTAVIQAQATHAQAQNKLLYAAPVTLTKTGRWDVAIAVLRGRKRTNATGSIEVAPTPELEGSYWSYIAFPPVMIVLFALRERLVRRRAKG